MSTPDYRKIYQDMIRMNYPEKALLCSNILQKSTITRMDMIRLNNIITGNEDKVRIRYNQKLKSYDKKTIMYILDYQKKNRLNNVQLAKHFRLSRNTITRWKKIFFTGNNISKSIY